MASLGRRDDIQGLRAIAVLMVVFFHARLPMPGGFTGVDVFFVISGYVITAMLFREWSAEGRIRLGRFYLRRYFRLTPALALVVAVVALLSLVLLSPYGPQQTAAATGIGALLLSANFVIAHAAGDYFAVTATQNPLVNTWSLSVEEQFYLVFPSLIIGAWALGRARRRPIAWPVLVIGIVSALSLALSIAWTNGAHLADWLTTNFGGPTVFAFYGPFTRVWEFGAGSILAMIVVRGHAANGRIAAAWSVVGIALIGYSMFAIHEGDPFPGWIALAPVFGTIALLAAGTGDGTGVSRVLATRPLVAIGDWSYSWYLWHWPLIVFAGILLPGHPAALVIAAVISLGPAWLSYRFVEQPLRRPRERTRARNALVIAATSVPPIALCVGLFVYANSVSAEAITETTTTAPAPVVSGAPAPTPSAATSTDALAAGDGDITADTTKWDLRAKHVAVAAGCVNTPINETACRFGPANASGTVLMLGDSQAYALADGVIDAATALDKDVVVSSQTGCPFLGRASSGQENDACRTWQKSALAYALKTRPDAVVIANRSAGYVHPEWKWRTAATDSGGRATTVDQAAALWAKGMAGVVEPLRAAGIPVVVIAAVPEMPEFSDQRSLFAQAFGSAAYEVDRTKVETDRQPALDAEQRVAEKTGAVIFDPVPVLCTDVCASAVDEVMRYQDPTHLTVEGSKLLVAGETEALRKALTTAAPAQ